MIESAGNGKDAAARIAELGDPRDDYERRLVAMCQTAICGNYPESAKFAFLTVKHLTARRNKVQH